MYRSLRLFIISVLFIPLSATANHDPIFFPKQEFSIGFSDKNIPLNIPHPPHPFFWTSKEKVDGGISLLYEYLVFHTQKYFSVNLGGSFSWWELNSQAQLALTFFFVFRFWLFRTDSFNPYIAWSIGGPTLLSRDHFSSANLGGHFIFQDFIGLGILVGRDHRFDINLKIYHYSNADLFLHNDGFDVPAVLTVGYIFKSI